MWTPVTRDDEWKAAVLALLQQIAGALEKPAASPPKYLCDCGQSFDTPLAKARHVRAAHKGESK